VAKKLKLSYTDRRAESSRNTPTSWGRPSSKSAAACN
jgi:hypothetical protein